MPLKDFRGLHMLGKGTYGVVYSAIRSEDEGTWACARLPCAQLRHQGSAHQPPDALRADALNEIRLLASLPHRYIIHYFDAFIERNKLYMVMEYAKHGDLYQFIRKAVAKNKIIEESTVWLYFLQLTIALHELHSRNVIHRDLKSKNIFIPSYSRIALGDLGCSKHMKSRLTRTQVGTPYYMSPELMKKQAYNAKCDIWALGILLYEMMALHPPFMADDMDGLNRKICSANPPTIPKYFSPVLGDIVNLLLRKDASQRPSASEVLQLPSVALRLQSLPEIDCSHSESPLLGTIKIPTNSKYKLNVQLPKSRYPASEKENCTPTPQTTAPKIVPEPICSKSEALRSNAAPKKTSSSSAASSAILKSPSKTALPSVAASAPSLALASPVASKTVRINPSSPRPAAAAAAPHVPTTARARIPRPMYFKAGGGVGRV